MALSLRVHNTTSINAAPQTACDVSTNRPTDALVRLGPNYKTMAGEATSSTAGKGGHSSMYTRKLYASVTASTNDAAHIDMLRSGRLRCIQLTAAASGVASAADLLDVELSFNSTSQVTTNDANGVLAQMHCVTSLTTSGALMATCTVAIPTDIPVKSGDRIYINVVESGTGTWKIAAVLHLE